MPAFPMIIHLHWLHNHEIHSADALKERDVSENSKQKILDLFRAGHSPTSALDTYKYDLQEEHSDDEYIKLSADRAICPDVQYCYR